MPPACVLLFFLTFVLPQFATVLRDFGAKVDPIVLTFLNFSTVMRNNSDAVLAILAAVDRRQLAAAAPARAFDAA